MGEPRISVITPVYNPPRDAFEDTVASMLGQTFDQWEWVLADDCSTEEWVRPRLRELAATDDRIRIVEREENGHIAAASNSALAEATGEFVGLLDNDDVLDCTALAASLAAIDEAQLDGDVIDYCYSDQDMMTVSGELRNPFRKPDWSPERLRHHMYTSHFAVFRRQVVNDVGGFREGFEGSQEHDLVFRVTERERGIVHVPKILYHWRQVAGSAAADANAKPYAREAGLRAVQEHLDRVGIEGKVVPGALRYTYQVNRVPDTTTPVSVIVPTIGTTAKVWGQTRNLVTETVRSVLERTEHKALDFVVVYDTPTPPSTLAELRAICEEFATPVRFIEFREPFNFSAKCNVGAFHATGEILLFLNDDMEACSDGVIESLIAPLREDGVGMTGAKLLFESGLIQHAGVTYGAGTISHNYFKSPGDSVGFHGELMMNRECSGITGACMAIRREVFEAAGGFNEALPANYNDVDLSHKVRAMGLRLVWMHQVVLYHFESSSRQPMVHPFEKKTVTARWGNYKVTRERYSSYKQLPRHALLAAESE